MYDDIRKMLRAIINGQSALKGELLTEIGKVNKKVDDVDKKIDKVEINLTNSLDMIGSQVAYLDVEKKVASA